MFKSRTNYNGSEAKDLKSVSSYMLISLLPLISKILEMMLLEKNNELSAADLFGFKHNHSTVQVHRIV